MVKVKAIEFKVYAMQEVMIGITLLIFISITSSSSVSSVSRPIFVTITTTTIVIIIIIITIVDTCPYINRSIKLILGAMVGYIQWVIARRERGNVTVNKRFNVTIVALLIILQIAITIIITRRICVIASLLSMITLFDAQCMV